MTTPELPTRRVNTLADRYCALHGGVPHQFAAVVFRRGLYPHARPLFVLLRAIGRADVFAADYDFVGDVGNLLRLRDFDLAVAEYARHPANCGWLRRWLRLRVSVQRVRHVASEVLVLSELARLAEPGHSPAASGSTIM